MWLHQHLGRLDGQSCVHARCQNSNSNRPHFASDRQFCVGRCLLEAGNRRRQQAVCTSTSNRIAHTVPRAYNNRCSVGFSGFGSQARRLRRWKALKTPGGTARGQAQDEVCKDQSSVAAHSLCQPEQAHMAQAHIAHACVWGRCIRMARPWTLMRSSNMHLCRFTLATARSRGEAPCKCAFLLVIGHAHGSCRGAGCLAAAGAICKHSALRLRVRRR